LESTLKGALAGGAAGAGAHYLPGLLMRSRAYERKFMDNMLLQTEESINAVRKMHAQQRILGRIGGATAGGAAGLASLL
jgi:outer membrane lipoprotein SlyB